MNDKMQLALKAYSFLCKEPNPKDILWLNFAVTYCCNSRCKMCSIWKKYISSPHLVKDELQLDEIESLLKSKYLSNLHGIGLTGGEPFLRKDVVDLVGLFIRKYPNAFIGIASNGLDSDLVVGKTEEILKEFRPNNFAVSLSCDGIGLTHNNVRGINDAYDNLIKTINRLISIDANIGLQFTITPLNYFDLHNVYNLCKSKGIKFLTGFAHNSNSYYDNSRINFNWTDSELNIIDNYIEMIVKDIVGNETFYNKIINPYPYYIIKCTDYQKSKSKMFNCFSGTHSFFINPYGDIYPCLLNDCKMGNIKESNFDDFWFSSAANNVRCTINSGKCSCWISCEAIPSLMRTSAIIKWNISNKILGRHR